MGKKIAIFIGMESKENIVTGGERQLQEMIKGMQRNSINVEFVSVNEALKEIPVIVKGYTNREVYIISDYSKRFQLWKTNWICRYKYKFRICCTVGAFYFDYRTSRLKNGIDYIISFLYLKPADLIFTTGQAVSRKLRKMGCRRKKIKDIYPAVRESLLREAENAIETMSVGDKKIVLTVGRFHPVKGYDYLLDAIKHCINMPDIHFVIVGDFERKPDDYYRKIVKRVHDENLEDKITIYGKTKDDHELALLYRKAWCCLHTSVWESSPITVCEAMLFGKPVIATNVGGTAEYLKDGYDSILVRSKDGQSISDALRSLYTSPKRYEQMCINALTSAEQYKNRSWNDVGDEYFMSFD